MNQLTTDIYGVTEKNGNPIVSSRKIAEVFNKRHDHILRDINKITEPNSGVSENFNRNNFVLISYKDSTGRKLPEYLLSKDGFTILAMGFTGKKAMKFKEEYINRFNQMEQFIKDLYEARADFPEFTTAIMDAHEEPKHYHFSNELNMINRIVLGMSSKQFKDLNNLGKVKSIRPYLTNSQIEDIKALQRIDIGLIISVSDFQQRKSILQNQYERIHQKQISA